MYCAVCVPSASEESPPSSLGTTLIDSPVGKGTMSVLTGGLEISGISGITHPLSTVENLSLSYSAAVISKVISFVFSFIFVIMYSFALPTTSALALVLPVTAYITSLFGAELKAEETVIEVLS